MRLLLIITGLLLMATTIFSQSLEFKQIADIPLAVRWMEVDKMKQLYLVKDDHTLQKYNTVGTLLNTYNENSLGSIHFVDVSNPFRLMVFYQDFATLVFLDRTLSEISRLELSDFDIAQAQAFATASDNNIWFFDNNSYTLKKISTQNKLILESPDMNMMLPDAIRANRLIESSNRVYLNAPELGIIVFDIFGNYIKTIDIKGLDFLQVYEEQLFYINDKTFNTYNLLSFFKSRLDLPILLEGRRQVCISQELIYIRYPDKIEIHQVRKK